MKNLSRLLAMVRPYWGRFFLAIFCLAMVTACIVAFTSLVRPIFDQVWSNTNFNITATEPAQASPSAQEKEDALTLAIKVFRLNEILPPQMVLSQPFGRGRSVCRTGDRRRQCHACSFQPYAVWG